MAGKQVEEAKGIDKVSQKDAAAQLAQGMAPPDRGFVEHIYEPDPNASPEPIVPSGVEGGQTPRDSKRKLSRGTPTKRVAKEIGGRKVAKTTDGISAPDASHTQKAVRTEVAPKVHHVDTRVVDLDSEDNDQETLTNLISKVQRSKNRSDRPSVVHSTLPGQAKVIDQIFHHQADQPQSTDYPVPSSIPSPAQVSSFATTDHPTHCAGKTPMSFVAKHQVISIDSDSSNFSDSDSNNFSEHLLDHVDKISFRLNRPCGVLPNAVVAPFIVDVGACLPDDLEWGQSRTMPSRYVPEVSLTGEDEVARVADAPLEVLPSVDTNPKEVSGSLVVPAAAGPVSLVRSIQPDSHPQRREHKTSLTSRPSRRRADLYQPQAPFPNRAQSEPVAPSSSSGPSVDPLKMLHSMSTGGGYIGEGYWKDPEVARSSERIRAVFNNGVYAVEELTRALITQERQASNISRLKKELVEKNDLLKSSFASESKIKQSSEERLRQQKVIEDSLRRTLANIENKASAVAENLREVSLRNSQLEASTAKAELRSAELESRAILAEQEAIKSEGEAKITKETLAAIQHLLLESQQKSEEAKLHYEKLVENLSQRQVSLEMLPQEAQLAREIQAVDRYKRSPAFDAFMLREQERGLSTARSFFGSMVRATEDACQKWDRAIKRHKANSQEAINNQRIRWRAYCRSIGKEAHAMHLELPSVSSFVTYHADDKADPSSEMVDVGPLLDADYSPFMIDDPDEISWPDFGDLSKGYEDALPGTSGPRGPSSASKG